MLNEIILNALDDICGLDNVEEYNEYYKIYNPLIEDSNTRSAIVFKEDGALKFFNGTIKIQNEEKTILTLSQWLRLTNTLKYYIYFICIKNNISTMEFLTYKSALNNFLFFSEQKELNQKRFDLIRKILYKNYILDKDVLEIKNSIETKKENKKITIKKTESKIEILQPNKFEFDLIQKYRNERKIFEHKNVSNVTICINDVYRKPSISFNYNNGFKKLRVINENKYRYFCDGKYEELFEVRNNKKDSCYVIEGEINALSIQDFVTEDIYALHNVNSIPSNLFQLKNYRKIIIKIDLDKYTQVKNLFIEKISNVLSCEVIIDYAINDITEDYNSLYQKNKLTKEIICKINENM